MIQQMPSSVRCISTARSLYDFSRKCGMERTAKPKANPRFKVPYIRQWRVAKGMSLEALADGVPMDKGNLSKVERGLLPYNQEMLERLADVLGTDPGNLINRDPTKDGKVIDMVQRLNGADLERAAAILEAAFGRTGTQG